MNFNFVYSFRLQGSRYISQYLVGSPCKSQCKAIMSLNVRYNQNNKTSTILRVNIKCVQETPGNKLVLRGSRLSSRSFMTDKLAPGIWSIKLSQIGDLLHTDWKSLCLDAQRQSTVRKGRVQYNLAPNDLVVDANSRYRYYFIRTPRNNAIICFRFPVSDHIRQSLKRIIPPPVTRGWTPARAAHWAPHCQVRMDCGEQYAIWENLRGFKYRVMGLEIVIYLAGLMKALVWSVESVEMAAFDSVCPKPNNGAAMTRVDNIKSRTGKNLWKAMRQCEGKRFLTNGAEQPKGGGYTQRNKERRLGLPGASALGAMHK